MECLRTEWKLDRPESDFSHYTINLYPELEQQTILGFGGAFTEASAYNYAQMSASDKETFHHMLGYLFAEIANFNYPTAITNLRLSRYSGIAAEVQKAESHGGTPITMSVNFNLTTYTSKKVGN